MDGPEDMEAESLAALLSGFQGGLGDLLTELIDHNQIMDSQFAIPEPIQRQSSGTEAHNDGQAGSKSIQKRERASSGSSEPSTSYQVAPSEKANKKATPRELSKVLQSKLSLLDQQQAENDMLKARCRILERIVASRESEIKMLQELRAYTEQGEASGFRDPIAPLGLTMQELRACKLSDIIDLAKKFILDIGSKLMMGGPEAESEDGEVASIGRALLDAFKYAYLVRPDLLLLAAQPIHNEASIVDKEVEQATQEVGEQHWSSAVSHMRLTQEQIRDSWLLVQLYDGWHARLLAERALITAHLTKALQHTTQTNDYASLAGSAGEKEAQLLAKLQQNLVKERCLICLVADVWWSDVLTAVQSCKAIVHSYPRFPDDIALMAASAALYSQGSHKPLLAPAAPEIVPAVRAPAAATTSRVITTSN